MVEELVKNKKIFFVFRDFDIEMGGLGSTVIQRAMYLKDRGYDVGLLNIDSIKNFDYILEEMYRSGRLSRDIGFYNLYKYYSDLNISNEPQNPTILDVSKLDKEYTSVKHNSDNSTTVTYFEDDKILKTELYADDVLIYQDSFKPRKREFFTKTGFNYMSVIREGKNWMYYLNDGNGNISKHKDRYNFLYHFIDEMCEGHDRPFLICDSTEHWYSLQGVTADAYKVGVLHGNPFVVNYMETDNINPKIRHFRYIDDMETLILLTDSVRDDLVGELGYDKFTVIPNFISDDYIKDKTAEKSLNRIRIFSRISPEKQIDDAIRAFERVLKVHEDAVLEIYGRALRANEIKEMNRLEEIVKELDLNDSVIFKGFLKDVTEEMQRSLCILLISDNEGLPLVLLESMANATPVIAYDLNYGPKDVITDGVDGMIIEKRNVDALADAMIKLLDNPDLAVEMGLKAREKIQNNFTQSTVGLMWEDFFKSTVAKHEKPPSKSTFKKIISIFKSN